MAVTLADATLDVASIIMGKKVVRGTATGGSATTLIDAVFPLQGDAAAGAPNDYYNAGTIWFLSGDRDGGTEIVTDWAISTRQGTATFATGTAIVATVKYAIAPSEYGRYELRQAVNEALAEIGNIQLEDTSLTVVANQRNYDIPAALLTAHIVKVEEAQNAASPYDYMELLHWRRIDDDIVFDTGFAPTSSGKILKLTYELAHSELTADTDTYESGIPRELVKYLGAYYALDNRIRASGMDKPELREQLAKQALEYREKAKRYMPRIEKEGRSSRGSAWMYGV